MSIIWIDIWDIQSSSKTKSLINRCFNVGRFITTIQEANMNLSIPNARIVSDEDMLPYHAIFRALGVSSTMALTRLKTIINMDSVARQMRRLIPLTSK